MKPKLARRNEPEYFLRLSQEAAEEGPYSIDALREMAATGTIVPETWYRRAEDEQYRLLSEDAALAADLWPEEQFFDPEKASTEATSLESASGETSDSGDGDVRHLLGDNLQREREMRPLPPAEGFDWKTLGRFKWVALRWGLAAALALWGISIWRTSGGDASEAFGFVGLLPMVLAVVLVAYDLTRFFAAPLTSFFDALLEGGGGGKKADFWTADSLLEQGEYRLAMAEYRRIAMQHPREMEAYIKGIRAARALDNEKEVKRFHDLALKNLKSEQDRNLFLRSVERPG